MIIRHAVEDLLAQIPKSGGIVLVLDLSASAAKRESDPPG
jgi:hypothetical protein